MFLGIALLFKFIFVEGLDAVVNSSQFLSFIIDEINSKVLFNGDDHLDTIKGIESELFEAGGSAKFVGVALGS